MVEEGYVGFYCYSVIIRCVLVKLNELIWFGLMGIENFDNNYGYNDVCLWVELMKMC